MKELNLGKGSDKVLSSSFLSKYTYFSDLDEMIEASGFKVENQKDFETVPGDEWNEFIRSVSDFPSWESMIKEAGNEWMIKNLNIILNASSGRFSWFSLFS